MRATTLFILAAIMVAIPVGATAASSSQNAMKDCNAQWKTLDAATKGATTHNAFMSSCMKGAKGSSSNSMMNGATNAVGNAASSVGNTVGNAASGATHAVGGAVGAAGAAASSGVTAATNSMSSATKTVSHSRSKIPVEGNTGTAARCKDGTTIQIHTHSGACSHHGGVAAWL